MAAIDNKVIIIINQVGKIIPTKKTKSFIVGRSKRCKNNTSCYYTSYVYIVAINPYLNVMCYIILTIAIYIYCITNIMYPQNVLYVIEVVVYEQMGKILLFSRDSRRSAFARSSQIISYRLDCVLLRVHSI